MKKIHILDTTLRDGEQTPGLDLSPDKKFEIARQLADLNVDVIEVGFPVSNESDFKACQKIAQGINGPTICVLARAKKEDIDAAYEAIGMTEKKRIHVFLATSKIHLEKKLMKSEEEVLSIIGEQIEYAKSKGFEVQFSPEDASRTSIDFMMESIRVAINSGATVINIPDTVGDAQPFEFHGRVRKVYESFKERFDSGELVLSVHCHNDKGQAVSNALAGVLAGANQVEGCVNGIGERTGNTAIEEVIMNIYSDKEYFKAYTEVNINEIFSTSELISALTEIPIPINKPLVGRNAFAHESGIHQHGVIKDPSTYEVFDPADIGWKGDRLVIGKHSGKHATEFMKTKNNLNN